MLTHGKIPSDKFTLKMLYVSKEKRCTDDFTIVVGNPVQGFLLVELCIWVLSVPGSQQYAIQTLTPNKTNK